MKNVVSLFETQALEYKYKQIDDIDVEQQGSHHIVIMR